MPEKVCGVLLKALEVEMKSRLSVPLFNMEEMIDLEEEETQKELEHGVDDIAGEILDAVKVRAARQEEMNDFASMKVYQYHPRDSWKSYPGAVKVGVRWVDTDKGSRYRSRLVAMEFATKAQDDLFAATPPLSAFKYLVSECETARSYSTVQKQLMIIDIKRAFLHGFVKRHIFL